MLDYQPDYRSLFNPAFRKQADKNNKIRREEERKQQAKAEREAQARAHRERILAEAAARRRAELEVIKRAKIEGIWERKPVCRSVSYFEIERRISLATGVPIRAIRSNRRHKQVTFIRQAIAYWAARRTGLSYPKIGQFLGGRDHTTILHAAKIYPVKRAKEGKHRRVAR